MSAPYPWLEPAWQRLVSASRQARLGHALLLAGRAGFGKRAFARAFAALLLCEADGAPPVACGHCRGCELFAAGNHPDFLHIAPLEEGKAVAVDQIRELGDYFALRPHYRTTKIALIEAADTMNRSAANALLKLLEEPPAGALIMLVADRPSALLPTVRSRCQQTPLDQADPAVLLDWLLAQEGAADAPRELEGLARAAGSPLQARALAAPQVAPLIDGLAPALAAVSTGRLAPLAAAAQYAALPLDILVDQMLRLCHEVLLLKTGAPLPLAALGREAPPGLQGLADALHSAQLSDFVQKAQEVKRLKLGSVTLREVDLAEWLWFDWQASAAGHPVGAAQR
jgi:DNA polymerase-3 subunit delta'